MEPETNLIHKSSNDEAYDDGSVKTWCGLIVDRDFTHTWYSKITCGKCLALRPVLKKCNNPSPRMA